MGITPQQFKQMQGRLEGSRQPSPIINPTLGLKRMPQSIILGLDPSLRGTGYGVIRLAKNYPETLDHGTISCPSSWPHSRCLVKIVQGLRDVLKQHQPEVCV